MKKVLFPILALVLALGLALPMAAIVGAADDDPLIYGMQRNTATIYGINPTDGTVSITMDTELWASEVGPNGLAYDEDNDIVYWVTYYDANPWQVKLCYWNKEATEYPWHLKVLDGLDPPDYYLPDGDSDEGVTCADFYDGKYYYIPNSTDDLYVVTISRTSDTYASVTQIDVYEDISGENGFAWNFGGDIAIAPDGVIYGVGDATPNASGGPYHFFSVELDDSPSGFTFQMIDDNVHDFSLQLAFGLDGTLYGHESQDDGPFYAVDTDNGDLSAAYPNATEYLYTDLASGPRPSIEEKCADLIAGQHIDVGDVNVWNDGTNLYVQYVLDDPWVMTESHLHVATSLAGIPQKKGNPPPGQFDYSDPHGPVTDYTYTINLTWTAGTPLYIAAHAEVIKVITEAPYYAASVDSYWQGTLNNGNPIPASWNRSNPAAVLALNDPLWFFSLGFGEPDNGWIIVEFDCPIHNGDGNDVQVLEVTNASPYPSETANVSASQDGSNWILLGQADNINQAYPVGLTASEFDLGSLSWAKYIKVEDTSERIPDYEGKPTDAFDLEVVVSLQDCIQEETAWGYCEENGGEFPGKNWATYITYHVE